MENARCFPSGRDDLVPFPLEHISHQELLDKMLKDLDEVAALNAVSCFMWGSLTRIQNSTFPWYLWERLTTFSRGRVCKPSELTTRNSERPVHNFPRNQNLTFSFSIKNRLEASNCGRSFCIQCSRLRAVSLYSSVSQARERASGAERRSHETRETRAQAREEKRESRAFPVSRLQSRACAFLRVLFNGLRKRRDCSYCTVFYTVKMFVRV